MEGAHVDGGDLAVKRKMDIGVGVERTRVHEKWNAQSVAKVGHKGAGYFVVASRRVVLGDRIMNAKDKAVISPASMVEWFRASPDFVIVGSSLPRDVIFD